MVSPARAGLPLAVSTGLVDDDRSRALACLTKAILYEAGHEPLAGQEAVAEVVMNRLNAPAFPKTICGVVFQGSARRTGCQFSFTCDGSLNKSLPDGMVARARAVAMAALDGTLMRQLPGATHYHADTVTPYWAASLVETARIGHHIFYRVPGATATRAGTPYVPAGETLPELAPDGPNARPASQKPAVPKSAARLAFMPWGLAPSVQAAAATTGAAGGSKE